MNILSSHYLPCIQWFGVLLSEEEVVIDIHEHYLKQTYRNRTVILTANGKMALSIPLKKAPNHTAVSEMLIENDFPWQRQHWQAIVSAYNSAPYFLYYQDSLRPLYEQTFISLTEWNNALLNVCLKLMKSDVALKYSDQYCEAGITTDYRILISPKNKEQVNTKPYLQVFSEKFPFESNLSMIDLLFNQGPRWKEFM